MKKLLSFVLVLAAVAASAATYPNKFVTNATPENVAWTNTQGIAITSGGIRATGIVSKIEAGSANTLVVTNGNVGIGLSLPTEKLQVSGGNILLDNNTYFAFKDSGGTTRYAFLLNAGNDFSLGNSAFDDFFFYAGASGDFRFYSDATETFTLLSGGNVGIGTTTPGAKLTVQSGALGTSITTALSVTNASAAANGAQQNSPALMLGGAGYNTTGSTSAPVSMGFYLNPIQSTTPYGVLRCAYSVGGSALANSGFSITSGGVISCTDVNPVSAGSLYWTGKSAITSPKSGSLNLGDISGGSAQTILINPLWLYAESLLGWSTNWPALRVENSTNRVRLGVREGTNTTNFGEITARFVRPIKAGFSTNYTINPKTESTIFWSGTNQVLTLPDPTLAPGEEITLVGATTTGSAIATNHNGSVTLKGTLSVSIGATNTVVFRSDGTNWW